MKSGASSERESASDRRRVPAARMRGVCCGVDSNGLCGVVVKAESLICDDTPPVPRRSRAVPSLADGSRPVVSPMASRAECGTPSRALTEAATPTRRSRLIGTVLARRRVVIVWGSRAIASRRCALLVVSVLAPPSPCRVGFHPPALPPVVPSGAADSATSVSAFAEDLLWSRACGSRSESQRSSSSHHFSKAVCSARSFVFR